MSQLTLLDLTASFAHVQSPTPFGIYDSDTNFQTDANGMIRLVYSQLGGNILQVELTNKDVYSSLEQSLLEYSAIINSYHAKSILANVIGSSTGTLSGQQNKVPRMDLASAKRVAEGYSTEAGVGGTRTLHSASISVSTGQQHYNLNVMLSASGLVSASQRAEVREIFHLSPTAAYRFFDTTSGMNYLHNQFNFESFTPETIFYMLPVWEDVLRAQQMEMSDRLRRSNYSYNIVNNILTLYPVPTRDYTLYLKYYLQGAENPFDDSDPLTNGVANLSNVPFGNIDYSKINSMGRQWVRRFALALAKEVLGQIRGKVGTVPIPNSDLTLNGPGLIQEAQLEKENLRNELKIWLESMTYDKLAEEEAAQAENLRRQLANVPMGIFVG